MNKIGFLRQKPVSSNQLIDNKQAKQMRNQSEMLKHNIAFLEEGFKLDGLPLTGFAKATHQARNHGAFNVLTESIEWARHNKPISLEDLSHWQQWIVAEQVTYGYKTHGTPGKICDEKVEKIKDFISEFNDKVGHLSIPCDSKQVVVVLGDLLQRFETIRPFDDANDTVGRILSHYITSRQNLAPIVMRVADKNGFEKAKESPNNMRLFFAKKIQEAFLDEDGELFTLEKSHGPSSTYQSTATGEKIIIEWHDLHQAMEEWL